MKHSSAKNIRWSIIFALTSLVAVVVGLQNFMAHQERWEHRYRQWTGHWGDGSTRFVDVAGSSGLSYRWHIAGPRPLDILQTIGNGCAFLDYDNDGNLDILLVGTDHLALFRGDGRGHFRDVSRAMGLDKLRGHFLGCAVGDYDNDGFEDVYVSGYRTGLLLHNEGGKRFRDVTQAAGLRSQPWGTSAAFGDVDNDGRLDLYVCNYVQYDPPKDPRLCMFRDTAVTACAPRRYAPARGVLYHNEGQGRFRDVTAQWGADKTSGNALGVAFCDYDETGRQSIAVANDTLPADLLQNKGGRFQNSAAAAGILEVVNQVYSGMGIDWGDYDNDGHPDLAVGTFQFASKPIFHNDAPNLFSDQAERLGFGGASYGVLTFGEKWVDYDNDGWLDLVLVNGHVMSNIADIQASAPYLQPTLLYHNAHGASFEDVSEAAGPSLPIPILGRGLAVGDFDNDGKVDMLIVNSEGAPLLLHNEGTRSGHWLSVRLVGTRSNRDGYGAAVTVRAGALKQRRWCHTDGSYLSASDARVHIGLGTAAVADAVTIRWPSGTIDMLRNIPADRQITIREGQTAVAAKSLQQ